MATTYKKICKVTYVSRKQKTVNRPIRYNIKYKISYVLLLLYFL